MISIDLGSNTIRFLVYDCHANKRLFSHEKVVKTADKLTQTGVVSKDAIKRIIQEINYVKTLIDLKGEIRAVTTQAVRAATNSKEVISEIKHETGIEFEIISGNKEAELTLMAVENRLKILTLNVSSFAIVDIGGGSTELTFVNGESIVSKSFTIGILTLAQSYNNLDEIRTNIKSDMSEIYAFVCEYYKYNSKPKEFISTAGTPTTVASMKLGFTYDSYDADKINGVNLHIDELDLYLNRLLDYSFEDREVLVGTGRSELIAAGILIYKEIFKILDFTEGIVVDDGLREGVVLEMCKQYSDV